MRKELENIFSILKTGTQTETSEAKKKIERLWHNDRKEFEINAPMVFVQIKDFDSIQDTKNKAAFISGLSIFFLVLSDEYFAELESFVLKAICNQDGHVRESIRKTADWLYVSLSSSIKPFVYPKGKKLTQKQIVEQQKAKEDYSSYLNDLELLMERYDDGSNDSIVYVNEMKPSIYKSLQMLWSDLTRGSLHMQLHTPPKEVMLKREEIEFKFANMLKANKSEIELRDIQDIIYNEEEMDDLNQIIRVFDNGSVTEIEIFLDIVNNAWNYFPHKVLDGRCPAEILIQNKKTTLLN